MKYLFTLAFITNVVLSVNAQNDLNEKRIYGGFGHFFIGPSLMQSKHISDYLKQNKVLGNEYSPSTVGYTIGGEGGAMFQRFYIGGGGFGIIKPVAGSSFGKATEALSGGYLKIGYRYYSTPSSFMHAYTAFGWMGYSLTLSNTSDSMSLEFNRKSYLPPGKEQTYTNGGFLFDLGTGAKTIVFSETDKEDNMKGGLMLGIDIGCLVAIPVKDWQNEDKIVSGPPDLPVMLSPYVRLTFGGGGLITNNPSR